MWRRTLLAVSFAVGITGVAFAGRAPGAAAIPAAALPVSKGVYRIPFADGTRVMFGADHASHPIMRNRIDMQGIPSRGRYQVVAAADGWIDRIVDTNSTFCPLPPVADKPDPCHGYDGPSASCCVRNDPTCNASCVNNFVWIRHANGEYTRYAHLQTQSVTDLGWREGNEIRSGEVLGLEGDVGFATGPHLHFEVAYPDDPADFVTRGGALNDDADQDSADFNHQNRIPYFCDYGFAVGNETVAAAACRQACDEREIPGFEVGHAAIELLQADVRVETLSGVPHTVSSGAGEVFRAGQQVALRSGFHAAQGAYFSAAVGPCDTANPS